MHNKFLLFVILVNCVRGLELFVFPMYVLKMLYAVSAKGDLAPDLPLFQCLT